MAAKASQSGTTGTKRATGKTEPAKPCKKFTNEFSKLVISGIIIANIIFTAAVLLVFCKTGSEPGVLVGSWFTWTTGECWALAKIKTNKGNKDE